MWAKRPAKSVVTKWEPWPLGGSRSRGDLWHRERLFPPLLLRCHLAPLAPVVVSGAGDGGADGETRRRELGHLLSPRWELVCRRMQLRPVRLREWKQAVPLRNEKQNSLWKKMQFLGLANRERAPTNHCEIHRRSGCLVDEKVLDAPSRARLG